MISKRVRYEWHCHGCDTKQEAPVWRLLDIREHDSAVNRPDSGLAWVVCPGCGTAVEIDAPLLLMRAGHLVPLLLAVSMHELSGPSWPPSGPILVEEAAIALGRSPMGLDGPIVPLPRTLLPVVLAREVGRDVADPDRAISEITSQAGPMMASWYRDFLDIVQYLEPERRIREALNELTTVPLQDLESFLDEHPELGSPKALEIVRAELDAPPAVPEQDPVLDEFHKYREARLTLLDSLSADGETRASAITSYRAEMERVAEVVDAKFDQLLSEARADRSPKRIPVLREALSMAITLHYEDLAVDLAADLGATLLSLPVTDGGQIEEIIRLLEPLLASTSVSDPRRALIAGNLGGAYQRRVEGDSVENWEKARALIQTACDATDRAVNPRAWALYQTNCGFLLAERPGGSSAQELDRGIEHIRAGLEERSPDLNVVDWAYSLVNLGLLHQRRGAVGDNAVAEQCYRDALAHLQTTDDLRLWTVLQNNLADLLLANEPPDLVGAESAPTSALAEIDRTSDPLTYGRLTSLLARIEDARSGPSSAEAIRLRHDALQLIHPLLAPVLHLTVGAKLVEAYVELEDWAAGAATCMSMLTALENFYDVQTTAEGRHAVLTLGPRLARWGAYVLARAGQPDKAIEAIERGRARQLSVTVSRDTADLSRLNLVDPELADRYHAAIGNYRAALNAAEPLAGAGPGEQVSTAEKEFRLLVNQIREIPGFEHFLQPMTLVDIGRSGGGHPVIYIVSAPTGSYVLSVRSSAAGEPVVTSRAVPEVTSRDIARLVLVGEDGEPGLISAQSAGPLADRVLRVALSRLDEIEPLMRPISDELASGPAKVAVVIPTGLLGLVPLSAAVVDGTTLDDLGEIRLAPSAAVYAACLRRADQSRPPHLVGIADPDGTLPGSRTELALIRDIFRPDVAATCAVGPVASRTWVLEHASSASHLHLACHGTSSVSSAVGGVLWLSGDDVLGVDDLMDGRLENCRLAVASACQSGHFATAESPDEFIGLPAAFLQAGAACAVASLWQVRDDVTTLFMTKFYECLEPGERGTRQAPVKALRDARSWLRRLTVGQLRDFQQTHPEIERSNDQTFHLDDNMTPYSSPSYWAAFAAWGC